ncbi:hypothetical protein MOQ72_28980 [Saccharopolyspora sp. K220]|uniref:hypothetical protein n=1 Tax=Saccharopolyspora soli TaxID=2926618 RepID=UPI001F583623|nr:hypothetical protein [Saccharopolyspora soli]MCI2421475.1 hypothetical protein [Saccharopolyspora soli]
MAAVLNSMLTSDVALLEQDSRAWLALPGRGCDGGRLRPCTRDGAWHLRDHGNDVFCIQHAALLLRVEDWTAEGPEAVTE